MVFLYFGKVLVRCRVLNDKSKPFSHSQAIFTLSTLCPTYQF